MSDLGDAIRMEAGFRPISSARLKELAVRADELEEALSRVVDLAELLRGGSHGLVTYQILSAIEGGTASIEDWPHD